MIITCPKCKKQYKLHVEEHVSEFSFVCPHCKNELLIKSEKKVSTNSVSQLKTAVADKEETKKRKGCGCSWFFIILLLILLFIGYNGYTTYRTNRVEESVKQIITQEYQKDGRTIRILSLDLVRKSDSEYEGYAVVELDGQRVKLHVEATADMNKVMAEWRLSF